MEYSQKYLIQTALKFGVLSELFQLKFHPNFASCISRIIDYRLGLIYRLQCSRIFWISPSGTSNLSSSHSQKSDVSQLIERQSQKYVGCLISFTYILTGL